MLFREGYTRLFSLSFSCRVIFSIVNFDSESDRLIDLKDQKKLSEVKLRDQVNKVRSGKVKRSEVERSVLFKCYLSKAIKSSIGLC